MKKETKISDLLQVAREDIIKYGWCSKRLGAEDGPKCALGAVFYNVDEVDVRFQIYDFMRLIMEDYDIGTWNDNPSRTKQEVLDMFDDATSMAMSQEESQ